MREKYPIWLFVVGAPGAGKTTISQKLVELVPQFIWTTDLDALKELFALNTSLLDGTALVPVKYWPELLTRQRTDSCWLIGSTRHMPDGGNDIIHPRVWDECFIRTVRSLQHVNCLLLEFSRGRDPAYVAWKGMSGQNIYLNMIASAFAENSRLTPAGCGIVHLKCGLGERLSRNRRRKLSGQHFVNEKVLTTIYAEDLFSFIPNENSSELGILCRELPVRVISLRTDEEDDAAQIVRRILGWLNDSFDIVKT